MQTPVVTANVSGSPAGTAGAAASTEGGKIFEKSPKNDWGEKEAVAGQSERTGRHLRENERGHREHDRGRERHHESRPVSVGGHPAGSRHRGTAMAPRQRPAAASLRRSLHVRLHVSTSQSTAVACRLARISNLRPPDDLRLPNSSTLSINNRNFRGISVESRRNHVKSLITQISNR